MGVLIQIVFAVGTLVWLWTMFKINQGEPSYIQKGLNFTGLAVSPGLIGFCLESAAENAQTMQIALQLQFISLGAFIVALVFFSIRACGVDIPTMFRLPVLSLLLAHLLLVLMYPGPGFSYLEVYPFGYGYRSSYGILFDIDISVMIFIAVFGFYITFRYYLNKMIETNKGTRWLAIVELIPAVGGILQLALVDVLPCTISTFFMLLSWADRKSVV